MTKKFYGYLIILGMFFTIIFGIFAISQYNKSISSKNKESAEFQELQLLFSRESKTPLYEANKGKEENKTYQEELFSCNITNDLAVMNNPNNYIQLMSLNLEEDSFKENEVSNVNIIKSTDMSEEEIDADKVVKADVKEVKDYDSKKSEDNVKKNEEKSNKVSKESKDKKDSVKEECVLPTYKDFKGKDGKDEVKGTDKWNEQIIKACKEYNIDPLFLKCIMIKETGGKTGHKNKNTNGTYDYGLFQINSSNGKRFDYKRMMKDHEYAAKCALEMVMEKIDIAKKLGLEPTVFNIAWLYNGYSKQGKKYAKSLSYYYDNLGSGKASDCSVFVNE